MRLEGSRVVLRAFRPEELEQVIAGWPKMTPGEALGGAPDPERLAAKVERSGKFVEGRIVLAIEWENRLVGEVQTHLPSRRFLPDGVFEFGVALYEPQDRGHGVGTEAVAPLRGLAVPRSEAKRVQGATAVTNRPMEHVLKNLRSNPKACSM